MAKYTPKTKEELKALVNNLDIYLGDIDTQYITDMSNLFFSSKRENFSGIEFWNTSNVANMDGMFAYTNNFNQPIGGWNVSRVINMASMFWGAISFNQDIGNWDVSNVTDMSWMFCHAENFNQSLCLWNIRKVKNMSYMFEGAYSFNQDISNWNLSSVECMTNMLKNAKNFQFEQPVKYSFYNLDKNRSNTMQNGKIIKITDRVISVELKYKFYGSVECSDFIRKSDGHGYLCLYNFENRQISSIPVQLNKTIKDNTDSETSVVINIFKNQISDMEIDLLSNPEVFGFCLTKNTESLILSELEKLLTAQFQTDYVKKIERNPGREFIPVIISIIAAFVLFFFYIYTGSFSIALTYTLFFMTFLAFTSTVILNISDDSVENKITTIINSWKKYNKVPFLQKRIVDKNMKQILQRISQVSRQQVSAKQNILPDTEKRAPKNNVSANKKVMISLQQLNNLLLISDNDLKIACSNTYKLCQMINSIEELSNKQSLKQYIENKLKKIEQAVNIWKSADKISALNPAEADKIKEKSVETIKLINNKLKEKIQYETILININLTSELDALQIAENLH